MSVPGTAVEDSMGVSTRRMIGRVGVVMASAGLVMLAAAPALAAPGSPGLPTQLDAADDAFTITSISATGPFNLLANDTARNGRQATPLTVGVNTSPDPAPAKGTVTISSAGEATYEPNPCSAGNNGSPGTDSFGYEIIDPLQTKFTDTATVTVTIMPAASAPLARADSFTADAGGVAEGSLLGNDCGPGPQATPTYVLLSGSPVREPAKGTVSLFPSSGTFRYTAAAGATGTDSFSYRISNRQATSLSSTATVTLTLTGSGSTPPSEGAGGIIPPGQNPPAQNPPAQNPPAQVKAPAPSKQQQEELPATGTAGTISIAVIGSALVLLGALLAAVGHWWPAPAGRPTMGSG
jgi:LPXTG-motif cell wall-anchored protein